jgi:oxidase EvaA
MSGVTLLRHLDAGLPARVAESQQAVDGVATSNAEFHEWFAERQARQRQDVRRVDLDALAGWSFDPRTGDVRHHTGKFFAVEGVRVHSDFGPVTAWSQPMINQPEIGILGIAVREINGVLHCLMQAKSEPGNVNGVQLSPTVQATRSNYTRVHRGAAVPYLEHFREPDPRRVFADVLQSEQGAWFYRKRNRNMIVELADDVDAGPDFRWLTLGQLQTLLRAENLINMDARTVLSCMPFGTADDARGALHTQPEILSWITRQQAEREITIERIPLDHVADWARTPSAISHRAGRYFSVIGVDVSSNSREVAAWSQPLLAPHGVGVVAFLVRRFDGVLHALVQARVEPGFVDVVELAPTVQCTPENYEHLGPAGAPPFLDVVRAAGPDRRLFDVELSEEGGRFFHARSRYLVIDVGDEIPVETRPDYRWMTLPQLTGLLQHSHYVNVQARTLVTALRGLS